jgi:hypothetical protein
VTRLARLGLLAASFLTLLASAPAGALDLAVNTPEDAPDAAIDGTCADAEGRCTLRAAVQESNASVEADTIQIPAGKLVLKRTGAGENLAATGDLDLTGEVTLTGAGAAVSVIQGKKDRILDVLAGADVTLQGVTLTKGSAGGKGLDDPELSGGAIRNAGSLAVLSSVIAKNKAGDDAGGITNQGDLTLVDVLLTGNKCKDDAGAFDNDGGTVTLRNVTISKNKAKDEGGGFESEEGGTVDGENVTLSGNKAREAGGANAEQGGSITLLNATVVGNKAKEGGGGVNNEDGLLFELTNTLLEGNKKENCGGAITAVAGNLDSGTSCGFSPPGGRGGLGDIGTEKLADNGGSTPTHALEAGSRAIDTGDDASCPLLDQRGLGRFDDPAVVGSICDSGAFERQGP